jgi:hypothetical protein
MIHYEDDVALGVARINLKIAENMVRIGLSTTEKDAARVGLAFLQRRNPAFADKKQLEIADKRDERIIDSSKLTTEERQQLRLMIERTVNEETE